MISRYTPTQRRRCEDPKCPYYGQELVDRGYGYPVCPSVPLRSKVVLGGKNKEMSMRYIQNTTVNTTIGARRRWKN